MSMPGYCPAGSVPGNRPDECPDQTRTWEASRMENPLSSTREKNASCNIHVIFDKRDRHGRGCHLPASQLRLVQEWLNLPSMQQQPAVSSAHRDRSVGRGMWGTYKSQRKRNTRCKATRQKAFRQAWTATEDSWTADTRRLMEIFVQNRCRFFPLLFVRGPSRTVG